MIAETAIDDDENTPQLAPFDPLEDDATHGDDDVRAHGSITGPDPRAGRAAERWLDKRLRALFGNDPSVLWVNSRDAQHRESDFRIRLPGTGSTPRPTLHIELKHVASLDDALVYWSFKEIEKAEILRARGIPYYLAIATPAEGGYDLYWSLAPLDDLRTAPRSVRWEWRSRFVAASAEAWDRGMPREVGPPEQPHGRFRIEVSRALLDRLTLCPARANPIAPVVRWQEQSNRW